MEYCQFWLEESAKDKKLMQKLVQQFTEVNLVNDWLRINLQRMTQREVRQRIIELPASPYQRKERSYIACNTSPRKKKYIYLNDSAALKQQFNQQQYKKEKNHTIIENNKKSGKFTIEQQYKETIDPLKIEKNNKDVQIQVKVQQNQREYVLKNEGFYIQRYEKYFAGEVLDDDANFKDFLTNFIEKEFKARIKRTKLLFRHQKNSNRNLHPFTDGKAPFVIVIKTEDGYCLAGISEEALSPQTDGRKRGWLISLTNSQRVFPSIPGKAAIQYDGIYLIFGNQQIRVKGSSDVVFSNFGIGNSYYETRGTVKDFIGPGSNGNPRETPIETFEIFQIIFQ